MQRLAVLVPLCLGFANLAAAAEIAAIVHIKTRMDNSTAEQVEQAISIPLERRLNTFPRAYRIRTASNDGASTVTVELEAPQSGCELMFTMSQLVKEVGASFPSSASVPVVTFEGVQCGDLRDEPIERDQGRFLERLFKAVPRGSSLESAREFVVVRGFSCTPRENAQFGEMPRGDFLLCARETEKEYFEIALFHTGRVFRNAAMSSRAIWMKPQQP